MHNTTDFRMIWVLIVVGLVMITASGVGMEEKTGFLVEAEWSRYGWGRWEGKSSRHHARIGGHGLGGSWQIVLLHSLMIGGLWELSGRIGWMGWQWLPWLVWLVPGGGCWWSKLKRGIWEVQRWVLLGYLGLALWQGISQLWAGVRLVPGMLNLAAAGGEGPQVQVERQADGSYTLHGHKLRFFTLAECAICDRGHCIKPAYRGSSHCGWMAQSDFGGDC